MDDKIWYVRSEEGAVYGPASSASLLDWVKDGRVDPSGYVSKDRINWIPPQTLPELEMRWLVETELGKYFGPFHRELVKQLVADGSVPPGARIYCSWDIPVDKDPDPVIVEKVVEKVVEVPVEKIVEVEKIVIDETRVKELEGLLEEERRHSGELLTKVDETSRNAAEAAKAATEREAALKGEIRVATERADKLEAALKDAADRENKFTEQVAHLEDELRRLPQAASEVADIQAAVYSIMKGESEELERLLEAEKREFEEVKKRYAERTDKLTERRRELLKRSGSNIEDMTRKALLNRPEDPRTSQIRKEFEEFRRAHDHQILDSEAKIRELAEALRLSQADGKRAAEGMKDVTQLRQEVELLRERLQTREKELTAERQITEELRQQQATKQQALLARLASLESPSIGTSTTLSTNQSREARQVKLPGWMSFRK